jgi:hypothetical protein
MKKFFKNQRGEFLYMVIVLLGVVSLGFFAQSCSKDDDYFSDKNDYLDESIASSKFFEVINTIESQDLQIVLDSVFHVVEKIKEKCNIRINICDDVVTAIKAGANIESTGSSRQLVRLKSANPETTASGWTYLGEVNEGVSGTIDAVKLYNKYKETWNYSCLELRLETEKRSVSDKLYMNVYVRRCQ